MKRPYEMALTAFEAKECEAERRRLCEIEPLAPVFLQVRAENLALPLSIEVSKVVRRLLQTRAARA